MGGWVGDDGAHVGQHQDENSSYRYTEGQVNTHSLYYTEGKRFRMNLGARSCWAKCVGSKTGCVKRFYQVRKCGVTAD